MQTKAKSKRQVITNCSYCGKEVVRFLSAYKHATTHFCNKSCHRSFKNGIENPLRDRSGEKNSMFGKHPTAWNKGLIGEESHNWKGGITTRKDGYVRIRINKKRYLLHRFLKGVHLIKGKVVHHLDSNPSNNSLENLMVFDSQAEHVKYESNALSGNNC